VNASGALRTSGVRVRDARPDELDTVSSLLAEVYSAFRPHLPADAWHSYLGEVVDVRSRVADSDLLVAEIEHALVGTVGFYPDAARSTLERWPPGWASIRAVAVMSDARGRGVGETLARECLRRAEESGARAVGLHTASFMSAATRLYERLGFRRAPEFDIEIGEMFTGRSLPPEASWQAQAYRIDMEGP
jgi:ribosomal protein S18 acetylase RimI-like enzyme